MPSEGDLQVTLNQRRFMTKVIARDRLSSCLYKDLSTSRLLWMSTWVQELKEKHPEVEVQFSTECILVQCATRVSRAF